MSSRKSNKFTESEVEQVAETVVEDVVTGVEELTDPEVIEQSPVGEEPVADANAEQAEAERLNRVNDIEKLIIQHQESIKQLRSELKKLDGKTKREGPTKMESCLALYKENPGLTRKEYVQMFQDKCGLTVAGSRTYTQLILSKHK
jgi:uncharacterized phage infection (PIP) family protein YhgE